MTGQAVPADDPFRRRVREQRHLWECCTLEELVTVREGLLRMYPHTLDQMTALETLRATLLKTLGQVEGQMATIQKNLRNEKLRAHVCVGSQCFQPMAPAVAGEERWFGEYCAKCRALFQGTLSVPDGPVSDRE